MVPAGVSAVITSFAGFCLVSFFRQQAKYENNFEEMDYVIGTGEGSTQDQLVSD